MGNALRNVLTPIINYLVDIIIQKLYLTADILPDKVKKQEMKLLKRIQDDKLSWIDEDGNVITFDDLQDTVEDEDEFDVLYQYDEDLAKRRPKAAKRQRLRLTKMSQFEISMMLWRSTISIDTVAHMSERLSVIKNLEAPTSVFVSHIKSPTEFYIQNIRKHRATQLDKLHDEMSNYYKVEQNRHLCAFDNRQSLMSGNLVAVLFDDGKCCRGYVLLIDDGDNDNGNHNQNSIAFVYYVDYGHCEKHVLEELFLMPNGFVSKMPFQAIRCSLNFKNQEPKLQWTFKQIKAFRELSRECLWKPVVTVRCLSIFDPVKAETTNPSNGQMVDHHKPSSKCKEILNQLPKHSVEMFAEPIQPHHDKINVGDYLLSMNQTIKNH